MTLEFDLDSVLVLTEINCDNPSLLARVSYTSGHSTGWGNILN